MADPKTVDMDSLLDGTLDDLADMPTFQPFPPGTHRFNIFWSQKKVNNHPTVELRLKAIETKELENSSDTPLTEGDETTVLFMLDNEMGQGAFKELMKVMTTHYGRHTNRELMELSEGAEVLGVTKQQVDKKNDKVYTKIIEMVVV